MLCAKRNHSQKDMDSVYFMRRCEWNTQPICICTVDMSKVWRCVYESWHGENSSGLGINEAFSMILGNIEKKLQKCLLYTSTNF